MLLSLSGLMHLNAQTFVNGNFESGSTGWTGCIVETGSAPTYGGTGTGHVAEVDGNFSTSASDDRILCQSIAGFTVGSVYSLAFSATRRGSGTAPTTVSATMTLDGGALTRTVTRSGGYSMVNESYNFTATQTTHAFKVTPNFEGSFGILFDNLVITLVSSLPIELLYFHAAVNRAEVDLSWATATEHDNSFFTVERSADGAAFAAVSSTDGAGDSQSEIHYADSDPAPLSRLSYYRLRQTDYDGTTTVSEMVPVQNSAGNDAGITLFPNPSMGGPVRLRFIGPWAAQEVLLSITDLAGREVFTAKIALDGSLSPIDINPMAGLVPGPYNVTVRSNERYANARLVVSGE
ncbi:MAG: hypothetical protein WAU70_11720 [Flavobacteriales bacterium]